MATRLIVIDVGAICSQGGLIEYGPYRFLTFCEKTNKLFSNYVQSAFGEDASEGEDDSYREIHGAYASWWIHPKIDQIDKGLLEIIFDKVLFITLNRDNYDDKYYSENGGYIEWINEKVNLDEFFEED